MAGDPPPGSVVGVAVAVAKGSGGAVVGVDVGGNGVAVAVGEELGAGVLPPEHPSRSSATMASIEKGIQLLLCVIWASLFE